MFELPILKMILIYSYLLSNSLDSLVTLERVEKFVF